MLRSRSLLPSVRCIAHAATTAASATTRIHKSAHAIQTITKRQSHNRLRPHLDLRYVRDHVDAVESNLLSRGSGAFASAHRVKELYEQSIAMEYEVAQVRKQRNSIGKKFGQAKTQEEKDAITAEGVSIKSRLVDLESSLSSLLHRLESESLRLPNLTSPETPIGPEGSGRIIKIVGPTPRTTVKHDHVAFATRWQLVNLEAGSEVCGSRFYYLQHELALLELALINYTMHLLVRKGWTPILPPDMVKSQFVSACGFQPRDVEGTNSQIYEVKDSELSLVGTAEIPLASMYNSRELDGLPSKPVKHVAFGHAFRTEAGGSGLAIRGLYRVHQFSKVELFAIATPGAQTEQVFDEILTIQQELYSSLGLTYRVLEIPSEDLGAPAYRKVDMEAWMPGRVTAESPIPGSWGEISSTSNCTDYQARRLGIKYRDGKEKHFAHTLNGTAAAIPRLLIAILEQHQNEEGTEVRIPDVLQPFMMGIKTIPDQQIFPDRKEITHIATPATAETNKK